jgi:hypothetical protein
MYTANNSIPHILPIATMATQEKELQRFTNITHATSIFESLLKNSLATELLTTHDSGQRSTMRRRKKTIQPVAELEKIAWVGQTQRKHRKLILNHT